MECIGCKKLEEHNGTPIIPRGPVKTTLEKLNIHPTYGVNHLEERLLDHAQARASYTPRFFWVIRVAYPKA